MIRESFGFHLIAAVVVALLLGEALVPDGGGLLVGAVDRSKFRKCSDTGFCKRHRSVAAPPALTYSVVADSLRLSPDASSLTAALRPSNAAEGETDLTVAVGFQDNGVARVRITEKFERWQPYEILQANGMRPGPAQRLQETSPALPSSLRGLSAGSFSAFAFGPSSVLALHSSPFRVELYHEDVLVLSANSHQLMHFEQKIDNSAHIEAPPAAAVEQKDRHGGKEVLSYGEDGLAIYTDGTREERDEETPEQDNTLTSEEWQSEEKRARRDSWRESFGGHTDSRPNGPMSVGIDLAFPSSFHLYGIPEHASSLALKSTKVVPGQGGHAHYHEPYRMYNLDVFEYELDEPMALYGNVPMMMGHGLYTKADGSKAAVTAGVFLFNPSETFIDVFEPGAGHKGRKTHWISESGNLDLFLLPGPTPGAVYDQFTSLVGRQQLPPIFALGYHQCRWNYRDQKDVATVEENFEKLDFPVDVIWLDIEHTDGKRYFTWDKRAFPNPVEMQKSLAMHGRKMVTIIDPHIKRDDGFAIHKEATAKGLYIKTSEGKDFDGWCWPGSSSYLDFTNPAVRQWWAERFQLSNYAESTYDLYTWNDMNEPSVFNGPEVSMQKDSLSISGVEHREWHNLYGMYMQNATAMGLMLRDPLYVNMHRPRPFVLSRAFWAGSQRYGAMWTGDNAGKWEHLKIAAPMLLSIGVAGFSFCGADVGGFFGEPSAELFVRWYQAGAFTPFFRGHAHLDTKRREPWVFGEPYTSIARQTAMVRYSLLPYWYTAFYVSHISGQPVMRPMFSEFSTDENTFTMDDQWMVGRSLLVKPVTDSGVNTVPVYFPDAANGWYDFHSYTPLAMTGGESSTVTVSAPLEKIPVFIRGGSILPRKMRLRRSASLMFYDPFTIVVAPSMATGNAIGTLYMDDERTHDYEDTGLFAYRQFTFTSGPTSVLQNAPVPGSSWMTGGEERDSGNMMAPNKIERIIVLGQGKKGSPKRILLQPQYPNGRGKWREGASSEVEFFFDTETGTVTIKKPNVLVTAEWTMQFEY